MEQDKFQNLVLYALQLLLIGNASEETREELVKEISQEVAK